MSEQKTIIKKIKKADIEDCSWFDNILEEITDKYAKGYLTKSAEILGNTYDSSDEEYREELLEVCEYNIWGK